LLIAVDRPPATQARRFLRSHGGFPLPATRTSKAAATFFTKLGSSENDTRNPSSRQSHSGFTSSRNYASRKVQSRRLPAILMNRHQTRFQCCSADYLEDGLFADSPADSHRTRSCRLTPQVAVIDEGLAEGGGPVRIDRTPHQHGGSGDSPYAAGERYRRPGGNSSLDGAARRASSFPLDQTTGK